MLFHGPVIIAAADLIMITLIRNLFILRVCAALIGYSMSRKLWRRTPYKTAKIVSRNYDDQYEVIEFVPRPRPLYESSSVACMIPTEYGSRFVAASCLSTGRVPARSRNRWNHLWPPFMLFIVLLSPFLLFFKPSWRNWTFSRITPETWISSGSSYKSVRDTVPFSCIMDFSTCRI